MHGGGDPEGGVLCSINQQQQQQYVSRWLVASAGLEFHIWWIISSSPSLYRISFYPPLSIFVHIKVRGNEILKVESLKNISSNSIKKFDYVFLPKSLFDWKFQIATPTIKSTEYKKFQSRDIVSKKPNVCSLKRLYKKEVTCKRVWQKSPNKYELLFFIIDDDFIQFADCFNYCYLTKMENCLLYICSKGTFTRFVHRSQFFCSCAKLTELGPC